MFIFTIIKLQPSFQNITRVMTHYQKHHIVHQHVTTKSNVTIFIAQRNLGLNIVFCVSAAANQNSIVAHILVFFCRQLPHPGYGVLFLDQLSYI